MAVKESKHSDDRLAHKQYEDFPFPDGSFISREGLQLLRAMRLWHTEQKQRRQGPVRILDLGCGTGNLLVSLAGHFPDAEFTGIDASKNSVNRARSLAEKAAITNASFMNLDVTGNLSGLGKFEIVLCLGVLHHVKNMDLVFRQICRLLGPGGILVVWLYGHYGRYRHSLNQAFLKVLTAGMEESEKIAAAREFLKHMDPQFIRNSGFYSPRGSAAEGVGWLLQHPQWLVDQMIPDCEEPVTLQRIFKWFDENSIDLVKWFGVSPELKSFTKSRILQERFTDLSVRDRYSAMDLLIKPEYYFIAGQNRTG